MLLPTSYALMGMLCGVGGRRPASMHIATVDAITNFLCTDGMLCGVGGRRPASMHIATVDVITNFLCTDGYAMLCGVGG